MADIMGWGEVGARVRESRLASGMSQERLGEALGVDRTIVAKIESGSRRLDALELAGLSAALDLPIGHFLRRPPAVLSRRAELVEDADTDAARDSYRMEATLASWLRDVRQLIELGVLDAIDPWRYPDSVDGIGPARAAARWVRTRLGVGGEPLGSLTEVCESAGQYILVVDLPGDGASLVEAEVAVAVVSIRGDPGRRRATAAHELGHLILGDEYSTDLGVHASRAEREGVIDTFAAELLLPADEVQRHCRGATGDRVRERLVELAARYRTSWSLALRQAEQAHVIGRDTRRRWWSSPPTRAELMETMRWAPLPDLESVRVPPRYADAVMRAWRRGYVTAARALELMHGGLAAEDLPPSEEPEPAP